jgi:hypothetical protein
MKPRKVKDYLSVINWANQYTIIPWWFWHKLNYFLICWNFKNVTSNVKVWSMVNLWVKFMGKWDNPLKMKEK